MNFNERNPLSVSLLSASVEQDSLDTLQQLIKKGRNLDVTDNRGWTPLHEACALGRLKCLMLLLKAGARVEAKTHQGETPFYIACKYNRMDIVKALLNRNSALIHTSDNESVTPLHVSCAEHNLPLARLLVKNKVNVNAEDNSGLTPLQEAVMREDLDICKLLLENGANVNSREYDGHLAFHFACVTGNGEILKLLLEYHSSNLHDVINCGNCYGFTPLMLAVQSRCKDTIDELLKLDANADAVSKSNMLALHLAAHTGNLNILKRIFKTTSAEAVSKYCSISKQVSETRNENGSASQQRSLVSLVLDSESLECLHFILNCGLNCDVLNCLIIGPEVMPEFFKDMHNYAIFGAHRNIEVEVNIADLENGYEICCTQTVALHPISFLLKQKMVDLGKDTVKYLQIMLESGFKFDSRDYIENNLLVIHPFEAIMFGYQSANDEMLKDVILECLRLMIDSGISVDYICNVNEKEQIPLIFVYACRLQLLEIIPYLLQHSNLIDLDDLLQWTVHKIFMRIDPPPHSIEKSLLEVYKYLSKYTPKSVRSFAHEIRRPEYESRFNSVISFIDNDCVPFVPSLQTICRSVIRGTIKKNCISCPYQLKIRLNSLELPSSLLALLNYSDLTESQSTT